MTKRRMKYNPSFLTETELVENFVVRHADLEIIMGTISENLTDSNQHVLVIGPRGSGKTTLVHRVAAEIGRNADLREHWYPLIFSEESYEVVTAGEFWLEALFHLSGQTGDEKWKRTHDELKSETDDQRLANRALSQLLDFADSQGKRLLLIVENLNMLFEDLTSDDEAWKIRHTLINEPRLMLLATATCRFEHVENSSQAMFEMFKMHELKPLDDDECNRIWEMITGQKMLGERIKPLRILTGGNPRLLTIISKFSAHRSFRKLLDDLVDLIDDHTEYFKSHLDNLPATERKVYLALAGLWDASTAREIAQAARLDVSKTSSLLGRLVNRGAVAVEEHGKKSKWYVVAERMYNIYYLMRRRGKPADRVKATVKFLVSMYDPESAARLIIDEACGISPELRQDHCLAYEATVEEITDTNLLENIIATTPRDFLESPYFRQSANNIFVRCTELANKEDNGKQAYMACTEAKKLNKEGCILIEKNRYEQAIALFNEVIDNFGNTVEIPLLHLVVQAMFNKGFALGQLNRLDEEIGVYDELTARFKDADDAALREPVAQAMINKGFVLGQLDRSDEAIGAYDELIAHFADEDDTALREQVAKAMSNKGVVLGHLGRSDEAIAVYDELIAHFADADNAVLRKQVSRAFFAKGRLLDTFNKYEVSEYCLRKAIEFAPAEIQYVVVLIELLLKMPERICDALKTAEEAVGRSPENPELLNGIAWAFYNHHDLDMLSKAAEWSEKAVTLSPDSPHIRHTLACILSALGRGNEALAHANAYIQDTSFVERTIEDAIELFVELAASGQPKEALKLLLDSEASKHLEPIVVGIKMYIGEDVKTAPEIKEVAKDIVKRIKTRMEVRRQ